MVRNTRHGVAGVGNLVWFLRQVEGPGSPNLVIEYGRPGDIPVVGDWNGNGVHTIGVVRGNRWLLRNSNRQGDPDIDFVFGQPGDIPVVGDWNGDGHTGIGVVRGNRWILRNAVSAGPPDHDFTFAGNGRPVTGDWDGDGRTGVGWFNAGTWTIRNIGSTSIHQLHIRREWLPAHLGTERLMTAVVIIEAVVIVLLAILVAGLLKSHAEILRQLAALGVTEEGAVTVGTPQTRPKTTGFEKAPSNTLSGVGLDGADQSMSLVHGRGQHVGGVPLLGVPELPDVLDRVPGRFRAAHARHADRDRHQGPRVRISGQVGRDGATAGPPDHVGRDMGDVPGPNDALFPPRRRPGDGHRGGRGLELASTFSGSSVSLPAMRCLSASTHPAARSSPISNSVRPASSRAILRSTRTRWRRDPEMPRLTRSGIAVEVPDDWEGSISGGDFQLQSDGAVEPTVMHVASFPLPPERGSFGTGAVELMSGTDVFMTLFEYGPESAGTPLFEAEGIPASDRGT